MLNKQYQSFLIAVFFSTLLFAGCTKPPTEKVRNLNLDFRDTDFRGGQVFAPSEYKKMSKKINNMNDLMDRGKYKQAEKIADSLIPEMKALQTKVDKIGLKSAQNGLANVTEKLNKASKLLPRENPNNLSEQEVITLIKLGAGHMARVSVLQEDMKKNST